MDTKLCVVGLVFFLSLLYHSVYKKVGGVLSFSLFSRMRCDYLLTVTLLIITNFWI